MFSKYYQDEVAYLRELGREFAAAYPALAPALADRGGDPDVERLLEGVAFLTGRIRQKLDDDLPEAIHAMARLLVPTLTRPMPGASILELSPVHNVLCERLVVAAGAEFASVKVDGTSCRFRTSMSCELVPWVVDDVALDSAGGQHRLRVGLKLTSPVSLAEIAPERVRLHLAGELNASLDLRAWLLTHTEAVTVADARAPSAAQRLPAGAVAPVGFEESESLLPAEDTVLPGFRLLEEYFHFPAKFAFVDVTGIAGPLRALPPGATHVVLTFAFDGPCPAGMRVGKDSVRVHCVPVVNLFATTAEPIRPAPGRNRFLVRPAGLPRAHAEVYRILSVEGIIQGSGERVPIHDFFTFSHAAPAAPSRAFFTTELQRDVAGDGTEVSVSFGTADPSSAMPAFDACSINLLATNGQLANAVRAGEIDKPTASSPAAATFKNITAVRPSVPAPLGRELHWRVVAHAAMSFHALTRVDVLRSAIDVHNVAAITDEQAARANALLLAAIKNVRTTPTQRLVRGAPVRGVAVALQVDETGFAGSGDMHLFGSVLDRLFSEYVSMTSFCQTTLEGVQSRVHLSWPARSGSQLLL